MPFQFPSHHCKLCIQKSTGGREARKILLSYIHCLPFIDFVKQHFIFSQRSFSNVKRNCDGMVYSNQVPIDCSLSESTEYATMTNISLLMIDYLEKVYLNMLYINEWSTPFSGSWSLILVDHKSIANTSILYILMNLCH